MTLKHVIAYGGIPHDNGVFSFYRALRAGLRPMGWDVLCVSVGDDSRAKWNPQFVDEGCVCIDAPDGDLKATAQAVVEWCQERQVSIVVPQHLPAFLAALPHLPYDARVVHICMDLFPAALDFYRRIWPYVDRMVAATPRQRAELLKRCVPESLVPVISFAANTDDFISPRGRSKLAQKPLEIAWVARLNHHQKGVRWVPEIIRRLIARGVSCRLHVVGDGHDRGWLEQEMARQAPGAELCVHGCMAPAAVAGVLRRCHAYLLPTRYEGFGISIVEAMTVGCVPVVTRLRGITDSIIEDGRNGLLCRIRDTRQFADALASLACDPVRLEHMRAAAVETAATRFTVASLGESYDKLLRDVLSAAPRRMAPHSWESFEPRHTAYERRKSWIPGRIVRYCLDLRER